MALTPEDVVNKRFQSTKFREGYDQDEVDDFLDEIVVELRRLGQENDELKQRLVAADARLAELQRGGGAAAPHESLSPPLVAAPFVAPLPTPVFEAPVPAVEATVVEPTAPAIDPTEDTNNLLQLARRLHEEHVREGVVKKEQLIADGQAEATRIVSEAATAKESQLQLLEQQRTALQQRVDELRTFERDYRQQLRAYIQGQLSELESTAQPVAAPSLVSAGAQTSAASVGSAPGFGFDQPFGGSAPTGPTSAPSVPAQGYPTPQTPPPGQFPGYGS